MCHKDILRAAVSGVLWVWILALFILSFIRWTPCCLLFICRVGQDSCYTQLHLEVQKVIPGVFKKQVLGVETKLLKWYRGAVLSQLKMF